MKDGRMGFMLQPGEGETLRLRARPPAGRAEVVIKADPRQTRIARLSVGTEELEVGSAIPVHLHERQEEVLFIHRGYGTATVGEAAAPVSPGTTIVVPPGTWHSVRNDGDKPLLLVWIISPPGIEEMFREIAAPPGAQTGPLAPEEFTAIAERHGMRLKLR